MDVDLINRVSEYFLLTLKSRLSYSDEFWSDVISSYDSIFLKYKSEGNFYNILKDDDKLELNVKTELKRIFDGTYENVVNITFIFCKDGFSINLNFGPPVLPQEIYALISLHITEGKSIKAWKETSKYFNSLITQEIIDGATNHLWTLVRFLADKPTASCRMHPGQLSKESYPRWNWNLMSSSKRLTWGMIVENIDKPTASSGMPCQLSLESWHRWNWEDISKNPKITWETIRDNPEYPWDWRGVSANPNITWDVIKNDPDRALARWDWTEISKNSAIRMDIILDNPDEPWDYESLVENPNLTWDVINLYIDKFRDANWEYISENINISLDIIKFNPCLPWKWEYVSKNPNLTWDFIMNNLDKPWDWDTLIFDKKITWEIIRDNPSLPWNSKYILMNPNITIDIIKSNPILIERCSSAYCSLSSNPNLTIDYIRENITKKWDWDFISENPNMTMSIIKANLDLPWDWASISLNPNLTWWMVYEHQDENWNWSYISINPDR